VCARACVRSCVYPGAWAFAWACAHVALLIQHATRIRHTVTHLWPLRLHHIFRHYLINGTIFGKKLLNTKCVFWFSLQLLSKTFFIIRRIQRDIVINVKKSSCKVPVILVRFEWNLIFLDRFSKKGEIPSFIKIRPVGATLFHAEGQTDMKLTVAFRNFAKSA
jgi:hypothetical protein